jgi:hypothetical protein
MKSALLWDIMQCRVVILYAWRHMFLWRHYSYQIIWCLHQRTQFPGVFLIKNLVMEWSGGVWYRIVVMGV